MSHTKELTECENDFFKYGMGDREVEKINLCPDCNGSGARMSNDVLMPVWMCPTCKYTGRVD